MTTIQYILGTLLIIISLALIAAILGQSAKSKRLGGAITGGAETFLGKEKGKKIDRVLNRLTAVLAILLALLTLTIYVFQQDPDSTSTPIDDIVSTTSETSEVSDSTTSAEESTDVSDSTTSAEENTDVSDSTTSDESSESTPAESTDESTEVSE